MKKLLLLLILVPSLCFAANIKLQVKTTSYNDNEVTRTDIFAFDTREECVKAQDRLFDHLYVQWQSIMRFNSNLTVYTDIDKYTIMIYNVENSRAVIEQIICTNNGVEW